MKKNHYEVHRSPIFKMVPLVSQLHSFISSLILDCKLNCEFEVKHFFLDKLKLNYSVNDEIKVVLTKSELAMIH